MHFGFVFFSQSSLKRLQNKGITIANDERPFEFSAVPFEDVLDLLMEIKKEQAQALKESSKEALSSWRKIVEENSEKSWCNNNPSC